MTTFIKFKITAEEGNKVPSIKAMRSAIGLGLKEAKDIVDAFYGHELPKYMVMRDDQFGRLMLQINTVQTGLSIWEIEAFGGDFIDVRNAGMGF